MLNAKVNTTRTTGPPSSNLVADTGTTATFLSSDFVEIHGEHVINIRPNPNPVSIQLPDESIIRTTHLCNLNLPALPTEATKAHICPDLGSDTSLLSIGTLCDAGCEAIFRAHECIITFMGDIILRGTRGVHNNTLWHADLPQTKQQAKIKAATNKQQAKS